LLRKKVMTPAGCAQLSGEADARVNPKLVVGNGRTGICLISKDQTTVAKPEMVGYLARLSNRKTVLFLES
jgi:hypothetical protein